MSASIRYKIPQTSAGCGCQLTTPNQQAHEREPWLQTERETESSARMDDSAAAAPAPVLLVTNDDGIDAPGLRFLVDQLVAARRYRVLVCAPDS